MSYTERCFLHELNFGFSSTLGFLCFLIILGSTSWFCVYSCRLMHLLHPTLWVLLMSSTQRRLDSWFNDGKMKNLILWFIGFESNLLLSHVFQFHCVVCNVFLLFGPSTRLMSIGCKMSLLWVTVTVTALCMIICTITLMRCFMFPTTSRPLRGHYGMGCLIPCSKMTSTLFTLSARCFLYGREIICKWLGGDTFTSTIL